MLYRAIIIKSRSRSSYNYLCISTVLRCISSSNPCCIFRPTSMRTICCCRKSKMDVLIRTVRLIEDISATFCKVKSYSRRSKIIKSILITRIRNNCYCISFAICIASVPVPCNIRLPFEFSLTRCCIIYQH